MMDRPEQRRPRLRRALSQATRAAPIDRQGDRRTADLLARALDVAEISADRAHEFTHGFHSYPARMHPLTARRALVVAGAIRGRVVLDPFCGSGTVLVEAVRVGASAIGIDASPLASLVTRAKIWLRPQARRTELVTRARRLAALAVDEGKASRRSGYEAPAARQPGGSRAAERRDTALKGMFAPHVRRELETIAALVARESDLELRVLLEALLSSILVKVSRREADSARGLVERRIGRGMPARLFAARAEELVQGLTALAAKVPTGTAAPRFVAGDARRLDLAGIAPGSVDVVVTSPPYAGTYDYVGHHELRLAFLSLDDSTFFDAEIGSRRGFADLRAGMAAWHADLAAVLSELARVLRPDGAAVLLLGDSLAGDGPRAVAVHADDLITRLAPTAGFRVMARAGQERRIHPPERQAFSVRPKREHLILLHRS